MTRDLSRREFLQASGGAFLGAAVMGSVFFPKTAEAQPLAGRWNQGELVHLIPVVNHERIFIKTSFQAPLNQPPLLQVGTHSVVGTQADTIGRFWQFDVRGLAAGKEYELRLRSHSGGFLTDSWSLKTFPSPEFRADRLRILAFSCAGGNGETPLLAGKTAFLPLAARRRLLDRALSFSPDAVIANGDHVYWDQRTWLEHRNRGIRELTKKMYDQFGYLDRQYPVLGTKNEAIFTRIIDAQIANLYGVRLRSIPSYFIQDDHDYFENDEAEERWITFPPDPFMLRLGRTTQHLYYPEFLLDPKQPPGLAGASAGDRRLGLSETYGAMRYGRLLEALMYDIRRYLTLKGPLAGFVDPDAEKWLIARTQSEAETDHLIHCPSHPFGWAAGKWCEWYPDILQKDGSLGTSAPKPYWQPGWWSQHQRLLKAIGGQKQRIPLILSGDLHALAAGKIRRSGDLDFSGNPVTTVLSGPLGTGDLGFPSAFRDTPPKIPSQLAVEEMLKPLEKNGFTILDVSPESIRFRLFAWRPPQPVDQIDTLEPILDFELKRR
jgi:hypothetical protein